MREMINILLAGLLLCGSAAFAAETRPLESFDKLEVSQGFEIRIGCGAEAQAVLDGKPAEIATVRTRVEGGTLKIDRRSFIGAHDAVTVRLTVPKPLVAVSAHTGVSATLESCAVSPDQIALSLSTGADLELAGATGRATIEANTGASLNPIKGQRFDAREVSIDANTGADITLCKVERLDGKSALGSSVTAESVASNSLRGSFGASFSLESCR